MASIRKRETSGGKIFYEIRISRGRGKTPLSKCWYPPDGWSKKKIEKEVNKLAVEYERQAATGEIVSREETAEIKERQRIEEARVPTFRQYVETCFMPALVIRCSEKTRIGYEYLFNKPIYPAIGDIKLPNITTAMINSLLVKYQSTGKSHASCVKVYAMLSSVFKSAYMDDTITTNPMLKVRRPKPRKDEKGGHQTDSFTVEEAKRLISVLEKEPLKWQVYTRLLIDTGLRRGEACGLQWKDIDFKKATAKIVRTLNYTPAKGVYVDTPKNGKSRIVPLTKTDIDLLKRLLTSQSEGCLSKWVFTQEDSTEPMHPDSPTKYFKLLSDRCKFKRLHPHKLRHTFASIAITNGADVASVSETLGHADKGFTLKMYTHASEESKRRVSNLVEELLK